MDVIFLLESSTRLGSSDWSKELSFVTQLVKGLSIGLSAARVGVVTFSGTSSVVIPLAAYSDRSSLVSAVLALPHNGTADSVDILSALQSIPGMFQTGAWRSDTPRALVLVTSSASTVNQAEALREEWRRRLREAGVTVYTIGVTANVNATELASISSEPRLLNHQRWIVGNFDDQLSNIASGVLRELCRPELGTIISAILLL